MCKLWQNGGHKRTSQVLLPSLMRGKCDQVKEQWAHQRQMIKVGKGTGGGIMKQVSNGPSGWLAYVEVDDIRAATKKAKSLGGEVMKDVTEVAGMGWLSFIRDPTGAVIGLWQAKSK